MTRIELDTRIAQLNADFVQERAQIDRTIIQHRVAIEELCKIHDKEVAEHKVALTAGKTAAPVGLTACRGASENI